MDIKKNVLQNYLGVNTQERRGNSTRGETGLHAMRGATWSRMYTLELFTGPVQVEARSWALKHPHKAACSTLLEKMAGDFS